MAWRMLSCHVLSLINDLVLRLRLAAASKEAACPCTPLCTSVGARSKDVEETKWLWWLSLIRSKVFLIFSSGLSYGVGANAKTT